MDKWNTDKLPFRDHFDLNVSKSWLYAPVLKISAFQGDQLSALWPPRGVGYGGWEGDARGRRYGDICICIADSLCYKAETNTTL